MAKDISIRPKGQDQAELWNDRLMEAIRVCGLRIKQSRKYPKFPGKFLTKERQFVGSEPGKLIGTLGWDRIESPAWQFIPARTKRAVAVWLQEEICKYCRERRWPFMVYIEPEFTQYSMFGGGEAPAEPESPEQIPLNLVEDDEQEKIALQVVQVPVLTTKPRYYLTRPKEIDKPRTIKIGGDRYIHMEPSGQPVFNDAKEKTGEIRSMPWGVICTQIEIWLFNFWRQTGSRIVLFDSPSEILEQIGFSTSDRNFGYKRLMTCIRDLFWCAQYFGSVGETRQKNINITPIGGYSLWDEEPAKVDSLGRRNTGRRKIAIDQRELYPSFVIINENWLRAFAVAYERVNLETLNQFVGSPIRYQLTLRVYEWGTREENGLIPVWGENGEAEALGLTGQRFSIRKTLRQAFDAVKEATGCPHNFNGDAFEVVGNWNPFLGKRQHKLKIPIASERLLNYGKMPTEDELWERREATKNFLNARLQGSKP